ncbi:hypothetical protein V1506DRAFT_90375 [Lipomyces tetrasporus]
MSKLIVVVGATGGQGGSVISVFLKDKNFKVRGITRNPDGENATALTACESSRLNPEYYMDKKAFGLCLYILEY